MNKPVNADVAGKAHVPSFVHQPTTTTTGNAQEYTSQSPIVIELSFDEKTHRSRVFQEAYQKIETDNMQDGEFRKPVSYVCETRFKIALT